MATHENLRWIALGAALAACSSGSGTTASTDAGAHEAAARHDASASDARAMKDARPDHEASASHDSGVARDAAAEATTNPEAGGPSDAGKVPAPSGAPTAGTTAITFAIHHLWLGDSLPDDAFTPDMNGTAWASFGYNIDGLVTTASSTDVCTLDTAAHATTAVQVDGNLGIDNSFGKNIVRGLLATVVPNLSQTVSSSIVSGSFTVLAGTVGLTPSPTQTNTGLGGALWNGASYAGTPPVNDAGSFLLGDQWPVPSASVMGSLDAGAKVAFPNAYVSNGMFVNGSPVDLTLELSLQGQPLVLQIHEAVISFHHTVDAAGQDHATGGLISGVLTTSEFLSEINVVAAQQDYCTAAGLLLNFIASSSDILHDGTNVAGKPCDGISIGIAFDADAVTPPSKVVPSVDAGALPGCVDAG